jgi:AraC-like DNA-binding protein
MMSPSKSSGFRRLLALANRLRFQPHRIGHLLDKTGRYEERADREFPFVVRLFRFRAGHITETPSWHERLELLVPLDRGCALRMGQQHVSLAPGDLLVVDNLKLHRILDQPGLNTRVIVLSFPPEFVYSLGSPSYDYTLLLPFYAKVEAHPHVLRHARSAADPAFTAIRRLLECYCVTPRPRYFQAGCKAYLLELLYILACEFHGSEVLKAEFLVHQGLSLRLKALFDHVRAHFAERINITQAAALANLSRAQFTRVFKRVAGMSFVHYLNHARLSHAARMLRESNASVADIASASGFADQSYFDRLFRKSFGQSPREFRGTSQAAAGAEKGIDR